MGKDNSINDPKAIQKGTLDRRDKPVPQGFNHIGQEFSEDYVVQIAQAWADIDLGIKGCQLWGR